MKLTHTHRGHCQACVMVQAIDPSTGNIAKHGYTVEGGYFSGTCPGSDRRTLHVERTFADQIIVQARKDAAAARVMLAQLEQGTTHPTSCETNERETYVDSMGRTRSRYKRIPWLDATVSQRAEAMREAVWMTKQAAESAERHANDLEKWADKITGKVEAYAVKDLDPTEWAVGDTIRIGGKKGDDVVIEAIEDKPYNTYGFSRGRSTVLCKHARVTIPAREEVRRKPTPAYPEGFKVSDARPARVVWEALRNIKKPPTALAAMLKKEGKL